MFIQKLTIIKRVVLACCFITVLLTGCTDDPLTGNKSPNDISEVKIEAIQNTVEVSDGYIIAGMGDSKIIITMMDKNHKVNWVKNDISLGKIYQSDAPEKTYFTEKIHIIEKENGDLICFCLIRVEEYDFVSGYSTLIFRLDKSGNLISKKELINIIFSDASTSVDNCYLLVGFYIIKLDSEFNVITKNHYYYIDDRSFITESNDTGFVIISKDYQRLQIVKLDEYGNFKWEKRLNSVFGYDSEIYDVRQLSNNDFIIIGRVNKVYVDDYDCFIMRTNFNGEIIWSKTFGTDSNEWLDKFIYSSDDTFVVKEIIGLPDENERKATLLEINYSGEIQQSKKINISDEYFYTSSDTYLCFLKNLKNTYKIKEIESFLLFYRYY
jgi:hypothetical protein